MKITNIKVYKIDIPLKEGVYKWAHNNKVEKFDNLLGDDSQYNKNKIIDYRTFIENNSHMTKILFSYLRNNEVLLQLKNAGALNVLMGENEIDSFVDTTRDIATQIKECVNE